MSFGWSVGDVIAGLKVVWDIWEAVSDGPLNAHFEVSQFFNEFILVINRLEDWERRKAACATDNRLAASNQQLREQCTLFIKRHMSLMQQANPQTKAIRQGRSTWLQRVTFTRAQVVSLYQHVSWPFERKEVERLREKLQFFLQLANFDATLAIHDIALSSHNNIKDMRNDFRTSNAELLSSNLKLVSSHLDLVSLVTLNLKRVTYPLEPGREAKEIDYPMLRHFEQALRPPQPLQAIEGPPNRVALPWRPRSHHEDAEYAAVSPAAPYNRDAGPFDQNEIRGLISRRLDNMSMRIGRVDTMESIPESEGRESISETTQPLLDRLRDMRDQIGNAVGIMNRPAAQGGTITIEPESALRQELEAWNQLEERIEREILHPGRLLVQNPEPPSARSKPIPIPPRKPSASSISPGSSPYEGWHGLSRNNPSSNGGSSRTYETSLSTSPGLSRPFSHTRTLSSSSSSPTPSFRLDHYLPASIYYPNHTVPINAVIHSISRFEDGDVHSITATSQDGTTEIRHSIDLRAPAITETSMKPFLDNGHVDKTHKLRVQFQGAHNLKITKKPDKISRLQSPPIYKFHKEKDFLEFQGLLLNKEVKHTSDIKYIKSTNDLDIQCRQGTLSILLDPFSNSRYILYFRHTSDQKHGFVEWPVHLFKDPKEPGKKSKTLTLESHDGKSLNLNKGLSRRSTQGSVATIASFESSAGPAFGRLEKKGIRGLVVEFYEANECHDFWKEFRIKEVSFLPSPAGSGLGFAFPAELAATEAPIARQNSRSIGTASPNLVASPKADNKRYADGLLERRNDGEYFQAPLSSRPNNDSYSELDSSVVAELANHPQPVELSATRNTKTTNSNMTLPLEDGLQSPEDWEKSAKSHILELRATYKAYFKNDGIETSLPNIIRDCIWPFYSNRLDKLVGPVDRLAEFERDECGEVTSVTIYLLCTALPSDARRQTVDRSTRLLLPAYYEHQGCVNIQFTETEATTSMTWSTDNGKRVWKRRVSWKDNPAITQIRMGDALMGPVETAPDTFETGSAGPWLTTPDGQTFLYTNEHVVRPGLKQGERVVVTEDEKNYIGKVIFTSADSGERENNATMRSSNPNAKQGVANLTDWAIIELKHPAGLVTMPGTENSCEHVTGISHVPTSGYGTALGAASRRADGQPWKTPFANEGVPYTIGKGRWYGNEQDLQCWTLSCPQGVDNMEWYDYGLGINGDSGTGVVDCETGKVCALVLGQVKSSVPGLFRRALVIDMLDVKNDTTRRLHETVCFGVCGRRAKKLFDIADAGGANLDAEQDELGNTFLDFEKASIAMCDCEKGKGVENQTINLGSSPESGESSSRSEYSESVDDEDTSSSVSSSRCHEEIFGSKSTHSFKHLSGGTRVR